MTIDDALALRRLIERQAIEDTLLRYGSSIDDRDFVVLRSLLCDDVRTRYGDTVVDGADAVVAWIVAATAPRSWSHHFLSVSRVDFVDDMTATALTYHTSHHIARATPDRCTRTVARYVDTVRRVEGSWKIAEKVMHVGWTGDALSR